MVMGQEGNQEEKTKNLCNLVKKNKNKKTTHNIPESMGHSGRQFQEESL